MRHVHLVHVLGDCSCLTVSLATAWNVDILTRGHSLAVMQQWLLHVF